MNPLSPRERVRRRAEFIEVVRVKSKLDNLSAVQFLLYVITQLRFWRFDNQEECVEQDAYNSRSCDGG